MPVAVRLQGIADKCPGQTKESAPIGAVLAFAGKYFDFVHVTTISGMDRLHVPSGVVFKVF